MYDYLIGALPSAGLPVNYDKTKYFGKISLINDGDRIELLHQIVLIMN